MSHISKNVLTSTIAGVSVMGATGMMANADEVIVSPAVVGTPAKVETSQQATEHKELNQKQADETKAAKDKLTAEQQALADKQAAEKKAAEESAAQKLDAQKNAVPTKEKQNVQTQKDAQAQSDKIIADKQAELDADPIRSAQEKRDQAQTDKQAADKTVNDTADKSVKAAQDAKDAADKAAKSKQTTDDAAAKAQQDKATQDAQATKDAADQAAKDAKGTDGTLKDLNALKNASDEKIKSIQKTIDDKTKDAPKVAEPQTGDDIDGTVWGPMIPESVGPVEAEEPMNTEKHFVHQEENLPSELQDPKVSEATANEVSHPGPLSYERTKYDTSDRIKLDASFTDEQTAELNDYAFELLNSWLRASGKPEMKYNAKSIEMAKRVMEIRQQKKLGFNHKGVNDVIGTDVEVNAMLEGTGFADAGENLGTTSAGLPNKTFHTDYVTMLEMKVAIYNSLIGMIYTDGASAWGHRDAFLRASANGEWSGFQIEQGAGLPDMTDGFPFLLIWETFDYTGTEEMVSETPIFKSTYRETLSTEKDEANLAAEKANNAKLAQQIADRSAELDASLNTRLADNKTNFDATVKAAADKAADAVAKNATVYADSVAANKATADKAIAVAEDTRAAGLADNKAVYDAAVSAAKDETPEERAARHAKVMDALKASEAEKLANLKTKLAEELEALKSEQEAAMANLQAELDADNKALLEKHAQEANNFPAHRDAVLKALTEKQAKEREALEQKHAKELSEAEKKAEQDIESNEGMITDDRGDKVTDKFTENKDGSITLPNGKVAQPKKDVNGKVIKDEFVTSDGTVFKTQKSAKEFLGTKKEVTPEFVGTAKKTTQQAPKNELPNTGSEQTTVWSVLGAALLSMLTLGFVSRKRRG